MAAASDPTPAAMLAAEAEASSMLLPATSGPPATFEETPSARPSRSVRWVATLGSALAATVAACTVLALLSSGHGQNLRKHNDGFSSPLQFSASIHLEPRGESEGPSFVGLASSGAGSCGIVDRHYDYPGGDVAAVQDIKSVEACCDACGKDPKCTSWTWARTQKACYLKDQPELKRLPDERFVSGMSATARMTFQIKNPSSNVCLDSSVDDLTQACSNSGSADQTWSYDRESHRIKTAHGDKCLAIGAAGAEAEEEDDDAKEEEATEEEDDTETEDDAEEGDASKKVSPSEGEGSEGIDDIEAELDKLDDLMKRRRLASGRSVHVEDCEGGSASQHWVHDSEQGTIASKSGDCLTLADGHTALAVRPCREDAQKQRWNMWNSKKLTEPETVKAMELEASGIVPYSLFCISIMMPWTDEPDLLEMQLNEKRSIFACHKYAVYSNPVSKLGSIKTRLIDIDLHCKFGIGDGSTMKTAFNAPIFKKLWETVINDGDYKHTDWTVKVDPDTVFLPMRLSDLVKGPTFKDAQAENGAFLNNCKLGLHGPIEILSRRALEVYQGCNYKCKKIPQEDVFIQHCLKTCGVKQVDQVNVLSEEACYRGTWKQTKDWWNCSTKHVAFHPFKKLGKYRECYDLAEDHGEWF